MSNGFNKQTIIGNLARDAELKYTPNGKPVANFRVIANTGYGEYKHTEGFNIVVWGKLAETLAQYLTKGKQVIVEGETRTRKFQGKDGQDRYVTEVVVNAFGGTVVLLGGGNGNGGQPAADASASDEPAPDEEEIPF